jgi:hypothetical protein
MWFWTRLDETIWDDRVRNELYSVNEKRNILRTIKGREYVWIVHILHRRCSLKHVIEGKIQGGVAVTGR